MTGFVLIHRNLIGNPQFRGKDDEYAAMWLVVNAAWEKTTIRVSRQAVDLERGQCAFAVRYLAQAWEVSVATAYRILKNLEKNGFIETRPETAWTRITICNYDKYQTPNKFSETPSETPSETRMKRERNAGETKNKEGNEVKERKKEEESPLPPLEKSEGEKRDAGQAQIDREDEMEIPAFLDRRGEGMGKAFNHNTDTDKKPQLNPDVAWLQGEGLTYLISMGATGGRAAGVLAEWLKDHPPQEVRQAVLTASVSARGNPLSYVSAVLKNNRLPTPPPRPQSSVNEAIKTLRDNLEEAAP
ncbi:MAG: hypothetical protein A2516_08155 [Alphaproteobacteria bacterium RIFOXYD12_FULL_60_8]|nr:MAG: hypothetical protein A2516_08155 [Alphaproteobacteria bacterium RIFOXYD12_FULL_60_8]